MGPPNGNPQPLALGLYRWGNYARFFDGLLDDVRIYNRALDAAEIGDLYDAGAPSGPVSYTETYQPWTASTPQMRPMTGSRLRSMPAVRSGLTARQVSPRSSLRKSLLPAK